jgi:hypothetical protein
MRVVVTKSASVVGSSTAGCPVAFVLAFGLAGSGTGPTVGAGAVVVAAAVPVHD